MDILEYSNMKRSIEQCGKLINSIEQMSIIKKNGYINIVDRHDIYHEIFDLLRINKVCHHDLDKIEEVRILYDGWGGNQIVEFLKPLEDIVSVKYYEVKTEWVKGE